MTRPGWIDVHTPAVELKALTWGPPDGPIALCLHGFPDTAYGWRDVAPRLAEAGWRVVAPFMRGYAPSSIPSDGSYHVGALMYDALQVRSAAGGTERDVVIGHDWGAMAANGLAAIPDTPFAKAVIMSVPPAAAFRGHGARRGSVAGPDSASAAAQLVHHVLPIALAARAFRVVGVAAAVEALVARLRRETRSAPRRRSDRHTGELARGAGALPRHDPQHPTAGAVPRSASAVDVAAETAEPLAAWTRRRLHDISVRALDGQGAAGGQRRDRRRPCRPFPAARPTGPGGRFGVEFHWRSRIAVPGLAFRRDRCHS